jgi:dTDP-4-dehydrorhamnose reductase
MINRVLLFGSNGMLGNYIKTYFSKKDNIQLICITRNEFEINTDNISRLDDYLNSLYINEETCVINCIGLIPQRNIEHLDYYLINSIFPQYLSKVCKKYKCKLICPTTDCVFSGKKGDYIESDFHDETNAYGISKSLGEPVDATVIRVSIIGEEKLNKKSFLEFVRNSTVPINGWDNHCWNGITCLQYCKIIEQIINENLFWNGIRHLYSPDIRSKYELACIIRNVYKLPIEINKIKTDNKIDKTLASEYNTNNIFKIPDLKQQIYEQAHFEYKE